MSAFRVASLTSLVLAAIPVLAQQFSAGCQLPFRAIMSSGRPVDQCPIQGLGNEANHEQNRAKNNFCAPGPSARVTHVSFVKLQTLAKQRHIPFGNGNSLPPDRSVLRNLYKTTFGDTIGEGTQIVYVGYILDAHFSNVSSGETVNCKLKSKINNDIHIALAPSPGAAPCQSITAEISPHFRPLAWEDIITMTKNHPVRITGQLFFDASHVSCQESAKAKPARAAVWEIHPIYAIDVCKGTNQQVCQGDDDTAWTPFHLTHPSSQKAAGLDNDTSDVE